MNKPTIYCDIKHFVALRSMLDELGLLDPMQVRAVRNIDQMRGIERGHFAVIANHPRPVDPQMMEAVKIYGYTLISFDDSHLRSRAQSRAG